MLRTTILGVLLLTLGLCLPALADENATAGKALEEGAVVLENDLLKVTVSPVGARIVSLWDKARKREDAKMLPYVGGMNEIRYGPALNIDESKDRYTLTLTRLADGSQKLVAVARARPTDEKPGVGLAIKEYTLAPGASTLRLSLAIENQGEGEIGLIPWMRHLINRGTKELPEEAHMTEFGGFITTQRDPRQRDQKVKEGEHHFPAANWSSRVVLPVEGGSNTLVMVTRPQDMLKIYNWRKTTEDFSTQEIIAKPIFAAPGKTARWDYALAVTAPVRNIVYGAPELVIGVTPHPTWVAADTRELSLEFASTRELAGMKVHAKLLSLAPKNELVAEYDFALPTLSPLSKSGTVAKIPVALIEGGAYQLRLSMTLDGKPFHPGMAAGIDDDADPIIPVLAGKQAKPTEVFASQTQGEGRLLSVTGKTHKAQGLHGGDAFDAVVCSTGERVFKPDTFEAGETGPVRLYACAGEYESAQIVLLAKGDSEPEFQVAGEDLKSPGGSMVRCESINEFIYVPTKMPSLYNALFPVGEYPEALLPVKSIKLTRQGNRPLFVTYQVPADAKPGIYRGNVVLTQGAVRNEIPVEMTVWNAQIPQRSREMEYTSSLKGDTIPGAKHADGTLLTRKEQLDLIVDWHLKYRLTPCDSGLAGLLLKGDYPAFDIQMKKFIDGGATKIFLGNVPTLLKSYGGRLPEVERYLESKGWSGYFYVRPGFDEASPDQVPKIKEICQTWKKVSKVPLMETYYPDQRADELFGCLDIWSRNLPAPSWGKARLAAGDRMWKVNAMPGMMETEPWISARKRYITLWDNHFTGSYIWTIKQWSGVNKWGEDYWCDGGVGNLSAVLMWPHETGILSTIRLEAMRDGLEDTALLWMLRERVEALKDAAPKTPEATKALQEARTLVNGSPLGETLKSAADVDALHMKAGRVMSALNDAFPPSR